MFAPSYGKDVAQTIRYPSVANLMIDSDDGIGSAGKFTIQKPNALQNGFFTRIGATEVVLNYNIPNIAPPNPFYPASSSTQEIDVNGVGIVPITIGTGNYTVASAIEAFISAVNALAPGGINLTVATVGGICTITATGNTFLFPLGLGFMGDIGFALGGGYAATNSAPVNTPGTSGVLQNIKYLDFVSPQLTYNQDVKDNSTNAQTKDVLVRWYLAFDNDTPLTDSLGFPIYMGYESFSVRRLYNPPKQIKWDPTQPVGNLSFEVWGYPILGTTPILLDNNAFSWYMTLQLTEN